MHCLRTNFPSFSVTTVNAVSDKWGSGSPGVPCASLQALAHVWHPIHFVISISRAFCVVAMGFSCVLNIGVRSGGTHGTFRAGHWAQHAAEGRPPESHHRQP